MLKHLGLLSILCMWLGTFILLSHHTPDLEKTISKHASSTGKYHILYGLLELIVIGLFSIFMFAWFIPTFELGIGYTIIAALGMVGTVVAAFVPDREGWRSSVHAIAAYGMAVTLMFMNVLLIVNPHISLLVQLLLGVSLVYMIGGWCLAMFYAKAFRRNALRLQIIYFLAYQIPIVAAVYF